VTNHHRYDVAVRMFKVPADNSYVIARWCFLNKIYYEAYWNSLQALEKSLKSSLLLNGRSAKGYGHNIEKLFSDVTSYCAAIIDEKLSNPAEWPKQRWEVEGVKDFIKRVHDNGMPDNRYNSYSIRHRKQDLHKLDVVYRRVRRLAIALDKVQPDGQTARDKLAANPTLDLDYYSSPWARPDGLHQKTSEFYLTAVTRNHLEGYPGGAFEGSIFDGFTNSPIYLMLSPLHKQEKRSAEDVAEALENARWLLSNVKLNPSDEAEVKTLVAAYQRSTP